MGRIDWDAVKRKGGSREVVDALIELARHDILRRNEETGGLDICSYCWTTEHVLDDCPIAMLECVSSSDVWYGPQPITEEEELRKKHTWYYPHPPGGK